MITAVLILFLRALIITRSAVGPAKQKVEPKVELGESEERMIEDKGEQWEGEGEDNTEDQRKLKKTKDPTGDDQENDGNFKRKKNVDPEDEDEDEEVHDENIEDELEKELNEIC